MTKDQHASMLIQRAGNMQEIAIELLNWEMFAKYHKIALRLIQYRINLFKEELK